MFEVDRDALGIRPRQGFGQRLQRARKALTTRDGLIGTYDYAFLFRPNIPFMKRARKPSPFFGLHDALPTVLALLLGFQHALAMLAGVVTPPIMLSGASGVNLDLESQQYLVSTALIVSGIMSSVQITRFHIWKTPYFVGTGMISVVGTSFAFIPVATVRPIRLTISQIMSMTDLSYRALSIKCMQPDSALQTEREIVFPVLTAMEPSLAPVLCVP